MTNERITSLKQKQLNRSLVYSFLYKRRRASKQDMSTELQLSPPTIRQSVTDLMDQGLIRKNGLFESIGGRKAEIIECAPDARISIGVEIRKKQVRFIAIDLYGSIIQTASHSLLYSNCDAYYHQFHELLVDFISSLSYSNEQILGIGIATQGLTSPDGNRIVYGKNMNNTGMLLSSFSDSLEFPCIFIHDAEAAAFAQLWFDDTLTDAVYLGLNNNIGGAVILNRKIHRGDFPQCGSIEHISINPHGKRCLCGRKGCLEVCCSGNLLEQSSGFDLDMFFFNLRDGNVSCQKIWKKYLQNLAIFIDNIRFVISSNVIIDGSVASYFTEDDFCALRDMVQKTDYADLQIIPGRGKRNSAALGAALHYIDEFLQSF